MTANGGVSIIICCYNSSSLLPKTLDHIKNQNVANINCEVILVDNASTDNTQEIARFVWNNYSGIEFKIVYEAKPGLSEARRTGTSEAKYEYLIFCDDDNWLDENYIQNVHRWFSSDPDIAVLGAYGTAQFENDDERPVWFNQFYAGYAVSLLPGQTGEVNVVYGAGMAIRKSLLIRALNICPMFLSGRKKEALSAGEDSEICLKMRLLGYRVLYTPQLTFKHFLPAKRLDWSYVKKLQTGFARTHVIINLHEMALNSTHSKLPAFYWLKRAMYYWGIYLKYWPKHYRAYSKNIGTNDEIHHLIWGIIGAGYLKDNFKTIQAYKQIISLKSNHH